MQKLYTRISQIVGDVITVEAEHIGNTELAQVITRRGTSLAQVIRLDNKKVFLQVFAGTAAFLPVTRSGFWDTRCVSQPAPRF